MILKASQRGGGRDLALHLLRKDDNEHIRIHELRGFAADDLPGAFKDAEAISRGTKCRQYLLSLSLSPPEQERVTVADFEKAIGTIETRLGLEGQPRAIVFCQIASNCDPLIASKSDPSVVMRLGLST